VIVFGDVIKKVFPVFLDSPYRETNK
jgi:hypothetical protein